MSTLGDAGTGNTDASYGGETGDSAFSMQYYRNKGAEFQAVMNSLDVASSSIQTILNSGIPSDIADELQQYLNDFDARKMLFRATAEGINAGAAVINSAGGRFGAMIIPQGLGFLPALPLAAIAAFGTAAALILWGRQWITGVNQRLATAQLLDSIQDPSAKANAANAMLQLQGAQQLADSSPIGALAGIIKWGAIAAVAYFAYRAYQGISKGD